MIFLSIKSHYFNISSLIAYLKILFYTFTFFVGIRGYYNKYYSSANGRKAVYPVSPVS